MIIRCYGPWNSLEQNSENCKKLKGEIYANLPKIFRRIILIIRPKDILYMGDTKYFDACTT